MLATLDSKTIVGLLVLLLVIVGLAIAGKLSPEAVDAIKWVGGTFMGVRIAANIGENLPGNKN